MMDSFKNVKKAKSLKRDSNQLAAFHDKFEEATKKGNKGRIDKFKKGFNADDRFKSFSVNVFFSAYTGAYGSSSVGSFLRIDNNQDAGKALIEYLRRNEKQVIEGMAEILAENARALVSEARAEIDAAEAVLADIEQ